MPSDYNEYNLLAAKYGIDYKTISTIDSVRQTRFPKSESLQEFLSIELGMRPKPQYTNGYSPVTVHCAECKVTFRFHRNEAANHETAKHCIYCGSTNISTMQDTELDCWEILANDYNMSIPLIKVFYTAFTEQRHTARFSDFLRLLKTQLAEEVS